MTYPADQTARLQTAVDALPDCLFAEDMEDVAARLADSMTLSDWGSDELSSQLSDLRMVGKQLQGEGGDGPNAAHGGISGLYCKGSDGYTRFLRAYAGAYRAWDAAMVAHRSEGNWAGDLIKATKGFFNDVGDGVKKLSKSAGEGLGGGVASLLKGLWPLFALIGGILLTIVVIAIVTKGKISIT